MSPNVDLKQLAVRREATPAPPRRRQFVTRYVLPAGILIGFAGVLGWAARDRLLPSQPVTVVPVVATTAEVRQAGTPLFQSAGWVEPRPTPTLVPALAEGIVDKLLVVEGQVVEAGQPVAQLVEADARLALQLAEADCKQRKAELVAAEAALTAAKINLEQPVNLRATLAEAEALLAQKETELAGLPYLLRNAEAKQRLAQATYDAKKQASDSGAIPQLNFVQAVSDLDSARATVDELLIRKDRLGREIDAQRARRGALKLRLELKTDEARQLADAQAQVEASHAKLAQALTMVETAGLRLDRMTVHAPVAGRILALVARPGSRLMGQAALGPQDASTVVTMFDPKRLQVRADVRLEDVPRVRPGQPVKIETPAAPDGPLAGAVLFPTSQTDIQKNTLQVKVAINDPPPTIHPDMLVQITFLAPDSPTPSAAREQLRLLIPRELVEIGEGHSHVWLADRVQGVARMRPVKLGPAAGNLVEVVDGLNPSDRVIAGGRQGLRDGQRITVTDEEAPPAVQQPGSAVRPKRLNAGHDK